MRSVFGMCGMHADGSKAQDLSPWLLPNLRALDFRKDKNAFVKYNANSGEYKDSTFAGNANINEDSSAVLNQNMRTSTLRHQTIL